MESLLQLELQPLFTQNNRGFRNEESKWLEHFESIYDMAPDYKVGATVSGTSSRTSATLPNAASGQTSRRDFGDELVVMARVQAYFRVAYKVGRTIDNVMLLRH